MEIGADIKYLLPKELFLKRKLSPAFPFFKDLIKKKTLLAVLLPCSPHCVVKKV